MEDFSGIEEVEIVYYIINDHPDAFRWIVQSYEVLLLKYLYSILGDWENARDIAQETFIAAYHALPSWKAPGIPFPNRYENNDVQVSPSASFVQSHPLAPWLYRIATNCALNFLKKQSTQKHNLPRKQDTFSHPNTEAFDQTSNEITMEDLFAERELLQKALEQLSEDDALCLILRFIHNEKYAEIAEYVGSTKEAVRKRISRGLTVLREKYIMLNMEHSS